MSQSKNEALKNQEESKKRIEKVLEAFASVIDTENDEINQEFVRRIQEDFSFMDFLDPEDFNQALTMIHDSQADSLFRSVISGHPKFNNINQKALPDLQFIYTNFEFIETHLEHLIEQYESFVCVSDKTRFLINQYYYRLIGEPYLNIEELKKENSKNFHHPWVGPIEIWFEFMDTLFDCYHGQRMDIYMEKRKNIEEKYERHGFKKRN